MKAKIEVPRALYNEVFPDDDPPGWPDEKAKPRAPRFTPIWLDDIEIDSEPAYLIEGMLPAGPSFGVTFGPPKSLKSFVLMDALLHVAIGKPYCERDVEQGAVIYVTSEGVRGVKRRLVAMRRHHGVEGGQIPFALVPVMPDLGTGREDLDQLISDIGAATKRLGLTVRAIAIDTLRRAIPGKSENDQKDMSVFVANCETLARVFNCHVEAVHHSPRSDDARGSGSNSIDGAADSMWSVTRSDNGSPRATAVVARMKDGEEGDAWSFELRTVEIGKDNKGNPFITGYVEITNLPERQTERAANTKSPPLSPAAKIALEALAEALAEVGKAPRASNHIPENVTTVVSSSQWREFAYRRGISSGGARAQQKAFERAQEQLQAKHRIGCWDDNIWIVPCRS